MKKKWSKKKIAAVTAVSLIVLLIAGWWIGTICVYNAYFNVRYTTYEPTQFYVEDFEGLECTEYRFPSDKGQELQGYWYTAGEEQHGIVVMAHGFGGGGHNSYMDCANYFAQNGYYVFAYDATGNDKSEGKGVGGLPQGVIDLDHAISFVEDNDDFPDLPIVLFGHSWGGYSVCNVLTYHPEVKAVVECSGSNSSTDLFVAGGKSICGDLIYTMLPFVKIHEAVKYGKYASNTAMDGFAASEAAVLVLHSADDDTVPIESGYDKYYEKYQNDPRFTFVRLEDQGHNDFLKDPNDTYRKEFNEASQKWAEENLDYDLTAKENQERRQKDKADYIRENLDRERWANRVNKELFGQFVTFYDEHI